ncbi:MAG: HEAT repeat domain-containing protein [Steroidobacteraceae bacterium]
MLAGAAPVVVFAFWLGVAIATLTLIMLIVIVVMLRVMSRRDRIHARVVAKWRPLVLAVPDGAPAAVPPLADPEVSGFIQVWNEVHAPLYGATTENLARIARAVDLERHLRRFLEKANFHDRVVAVIALGHIKSDESFACVAQHIDDKSPIMSLSAARSLMQIDSGQAVSKLVPRIVERSDWSQGGIATILQEAGASQVAGQLTEATLQANADIAPRLIRFLAGVSPEAAAPIIRAALTSSSDERLISTCLQVLSNQTDLDCVRPFLSHARWHLRMQAAVTLGNLGTPGDERLLIKLLADPQWWVRYRAAHALMNLSFMTLDRVRWIQANQTDPYAQDILRHVLAERILGAAA